MSTPTSVQIIPGNLVLSGNVDTNDTYNTFCIDRANGRVGIGQGLTSLVTDSNDSNVLQISGEVTATRFHGDGTGITGLTDSKWLEDDNGINNIYYSTGTVGIGGIPGTETLTVYGNLNLKNGGNLKLNDADAVFSNWTSHTDGIYRTTNVGIGGVPSDTNKLKVHGDVEVASNITSSNITVDGTFRVSDGSLSVDLNVSAGSGFYYQQYPLQASDRQENDYFGSAVAIYEDTVIVAAKFEDQAGVNAGAVYIFTRSGSSSAATWSQQQKIVGVGVTTGDQFGGDDGVAIYGDTAVAGTMYHGGSGAAYVYTRSETTWTQQQKLQQGDAQTNDLFGASCSISGDTIAVGGWGKNTTGDVQSGSVYVFTRSGTTWTQQQKLTPALSELSNYYGFFGYAVAVDGDTLIGGAYGGGGQNKGFCLIFTRSGTTWTQQQVLVASDVASGDRFGWSVAISGDTVVVGARGKNGNEGAAYVFTRSGGITGTWSQQQKITAGVTTAGFGWSVAIQGNTILVGADDASSTGGCYIFTRSGTTWTKKQRVVNSNSGATDFARIVALSEDASYIILGAYAEDTGATNAGSTYVFKIAPNKLEVSGDVVADGTLLSFTGQHICFPEGPVERGLVVSANRNKFMNLNGPLSTGLSAIKSSESLPIVSLSNVMNDTNIFGVVDSVESMSLLRMQRVGGTLIENKKESGDNRVIVNSLGEGAMWVVNTNGNISSGDYITTSNINGYGHKQDDDILHSYTVAKITMDCDFNPQELPIQVIKKDENGNNVLDKYGRLQWEDTDNTEKVYRIKYLKVDGNETDQANAVCTAAYVGCTYHCG